MLIQLSCPSYYTEAQTLVTLTRHFEILRELKKVSSFEFRPETNSLAVVAFGFFFFLIFKFYLRWHWAFWGKINADLS